MDLGSDPALRGIVTVLSLGDDAHEPYHAPGANPDATRV